jgi:hypothetical protein
MKTGIDLSVPVVPFVGQPLLNPFLTTSIGIRLVRFVGSRVRYSAYITEVQLPYHKTVTPAVDNSPRIGASL